MGLDDPDSLSNEGREGLVEDQLPPDTSQFVQ